jgi:hypothetical protein
MARNVNNQKAKLERDFQNLKSRADEYYDRWYESTQRHVPDEEVEAERRGENSKSQLDC